MTELPSNVKGWSLCCFESDRIPYSERNSSLSSILDCVMHQFPAVKCHDFPSGVPESFAVCCRQQWKATLVHFCLFQSWISKLWTHKNSTHKRCQVLHKIVPVFEEPIHAGFETWKLPQFLIADSYSPKQWNEANKRLNLECVLSKNRQGESGALPSVEFFHQMG